MYFATDAVAVTGSHVARTLIQRYGCDPSRVRTIHVGANVAIAPVSTDRAPGDCRGGSIAVPPGSGRGPDRWIFFETVTDGETGILVPPDDPAAIAGALRRLFAAPELARRMGLAGFERNRTRFNWDEVGKRLRSIAATIAPRLRVNG